MLIDWFTVGAQALNFIILVWLLKRFLYKPILNAVDAREKRIAAELADADAKKAEAQKERDRVPAQERRIRPAARCTFEQGDGRSESRTPTTPGRCAKGSRCPECQATGGAAKRRQQPQSSHPSPDPAGSVRHRAKGIDGSCHDKSGRAHERGVHPSPAHDGRQGKRGHSARPSRQRPSPRSCAARLTCLRRNARQYKSAQRDLLGRSSRPVRDRAGPGQRDRTHHEWTENSLEHRGLSRLSGKGCRASF